MESIQVHQANLSPVYILRRSILYALYLPCLVRFASFSEGRHAFCIQCNRCYFLFSWLSAYTVLHAPDIVICNGRKQSSSASCRKGDRNFEARE